jgi:hypothetical protein
MKQLYKSLKLLLLLGLIAAKTHAQVTVDATAGTPTASYTTLKAAFDAINIGTHQGVIDIRIHDNTTETASSRLDSSGVASGALYTSVLIRPADTATVVKTISLALSAAIVVDLNGADNVTIDGRPLGIGTSKLLKLQHASPDASASSMVLRFINGASTCAASWILSESLTTAAGFACPNINISTSTATTGNYHIIIDNCDITGGVIGINAAGTAANFMDSIFITNNNITNAQATSISCSAIKNLSIQSNIITHTILIAGWNVTGISFTPNVSGANYQIHRNRITNLGSASLAQLIGILISPSLAAPAIIPQLTVTNNYLGFFTNNTALTQIRALQFQGTTNPANITVFANTFRIGGSGGNTAGNPATAGVVKSNSAATSTFNLTNNLCINTRTGGANSHIGYWNSQPTLGTNVSDFNTAFGGPTFLAAWGGFLFADEINFRAAAFPNEQNSTMGNVNFVNTTNPDVGTGNSAKVLLGTILPSIPTDIYGTSKSLIYPYRGAYEGAGLDSNDATVVIIYTFGKIPIGTTDTIRAIIRNMGTEDITGNEHIS